MLKRLKSWWQSFLAWCAENDMAHRSSPPGQCCSAPPPGAAQVRRMRRQR
ncbi:MAG: hypothetical protein ACM3SV_12485 [Betaproteobacteria bacterium]